MSVATYTKSGNKATTAAKLDKSVFGLVIKNHDLLKTAYVVYLSNGRTNLAVTKTRGLVRGGGKKPWKQKGTGRARFGSTRNPIWRGGGVVFGPTGGENYTKRLNLTTKRRAVCQALSLANQTGKIKIVETFADMDDKTKNMVNFLSKIEASGNVLCVVSQKDASKERATQNIARLKVSGASNLNVFDILNADSIIITQKALLVISEWLNESKSSKPKEADHE